jgi:uncharacterized protein YbbK (DUF523 family)/uncharacterized protein YbgA (DUF1722 family)
MRRTAAVFSDGVGAFANVASTTAAMGQGTLNHKVEPEPDVEPEHDPALSIKDFELSYNAATVEEDLPSTPLYKFIHAVPMPEPLPNKPRVAMSACLLGHEVRYNKGHCDARAIKALFDTEFQLVPVCPEMDIGLGAPRPTLRLVVTDEPDKVNSKKLKKLRAELADSGACAATTRTTLAHVAALGDMEEIGKFARLYCPDTKEDLTQKMAVYGKMKAEELRSFGVDGFVLKKDSPTCGVARVQLYESKKEGTVRKQRVTMGHFAQALKKAWPELPLAEEGWLNEPDARDNFIQQVLCHARWRQLPQAKHRNGPVFKEIIKFHEQHKYILMAQSPMALKDLGHLLAKGPKSFDAADGATFYYRTFFVAMKVLVSRGRHQNVLLHLAGHLRHEVDAGDYKEMLGSIDDFYEGLVPLVVPLQLMQLMAGSSVREKSAKVEPSTATPVSSTDQLVQILGTLVAVVAAIVCYYFDGSELHTAVVIGAPLLAAALICAPIFLRRTGKNAKAGSPVKANPAHVKKDGAAILSLTKYLQGAPRSLKLHTSISARMEAKVPQSVLGTTNLTRKMKTTEDEE